MSQSRKQDLSETLIQGSGLHIMGYVEPREKDQRKMKSETTPS